MSELLDPEDFSAEMLVPSQETPRGIHYAIAHQALVEFALDHPLRYFALMASPDAKRLLDVVYAAVCDRYAQQGEQPDFGPGSLQIHCRRLQGRPLAIVQMPPPVAVGEAYFTALLGVPEGDAGTEVGGSSGAEVEPQNWAGRYFTLEMGVPSQQGPRTVLGEWTAGGDHLNYGDGSRPVLPEFVLAIQKLLD